GAYDQFRRFPVVYDHRLLSRSPAGCFHTTSIMVAPHEYPTPKPISAMRSPCFTRCCCIAFSSAIGIVEDTVLPDCSMSIQNLSAGNFYCFFFVFGIGGCSPHFSIRWRGL